MITKIRVKKERCERCDSMNTYFYYFSGNPNVKTDKEDLFFSCKSCLKSYRLKSEASYEMFLR